MVGNRDGLLKAIIRPHPWQSFQDYLTFNLRGKTIAMMFSKLAQ